MEKSIIIKNNIEEITQLSAFIESIAQELELSGELVFMLNLAIEEAVANIIQYAYPQEETHLIYLSAKKMDNQLIFMLTDDGKEFDPTAPKEIDITLSAEERPIGGLGIFLIQQIMNKVEYQRIDGKNILTLSKHLE